jgi:hypothetical protein
MKKQTKKTHTDVLCPTYLSVVEPRGFSIFYFLFMFQRFYSVTNQLAIGPMKMAIKTLNFICLKGVKDAKPEI